jgi:hypothetical protein
MRQALGGHRGWTATWRDAAPKPVYDVIIIGGGGHGLARHITWGAWRHARRRAREGMGHHPLESDAGLTTGNRQMVRFISSAHHCARCHSRLGRRQVPVSGSLHKDTGHYVYAVTTPMMARDAAPSAADCRTLRNRQTMRSVIDRDRSPWGVRNSCEARPPRLNGASPFPISKSARLPARFRAK